jgi:ribosome-associated protein
LNKRKKIKIKEQSYRLNSKETALLTASVANEKKALGVIILNVEKISSISDFIIICSGNSDRQVRAIADSIIEKLKFLDKKPLSIEGYTEGKWVLIDFNDIIIHVFYEPLRAYYRLEELWLEAKEVKIPKNYLDKFRNVGT